MSKGKERTQRIIILTIVAAFVLSSFGFTGLVLWDSLNKKDSSTSKDPSQNPEIQKKLEELQKQQAEGAKMESTDIKPGTGAEAVTGKKATVHYTGTLKDGTKFDSSLDRGEPFGFQLGGGQVIKGWDQGVVGMKVGGKRKLVIPAALAYGDKSPSPKIPPNSDLVFEIELISVE